MKHIYLFLLLLFIFTNSVKGQNSWDIQLTQSNIDCSANQICYQLEVRNSSGTGWVLGDQNYRFFFDGDLMTVTSVTSLLPSSFYSAVNIDQNLKISNQGQETASPLDDIDDNLGFLDFSIVQSDKSNPPAAIQLSGSFIPVAEICIDVIPTAITSNECLSLYHSRPATAGNITNQYTVISENNTPNNTVSTTGNIHVDLTPADENEACLGNICSSFAGNWDIQFSQSFVNCSGNQVCYQLELSSSTTTNWALGDQNYRLFFDGDLMTVVSVSSLLPSTIYAPVIIDQNIKITNQGQEVASPLDDIDNNLGFLDFNIIQLDKSTPSEAIQLAPQTFTAVAEICITLDPIVMQDASGDICLSLYHSRPATAGNITNQYTVISENDASNSTSATEGNEYHDLTSESATACVGADCQQKDWDIQFSVADLNCDAEQVCYFLELKNNNGQDWALGDQNYRLFFDGDLMTINSVVSLLPNSIYSTASINQNIKVTNQGQETASPLDNIDDNLGFLDFSIVQTDKSNPASATQLTTTDFIPVAEICVDVSSQVFTDIDLNNCLSFYHSRSATAGTFTNQYTTISQNNAPESTTSTTGVEFNDLVNEGDANSCLILACEEFICDLNVSIENPVYNDNNTANDLTDDTFTFQVLINGSNAFGWEGGGQAGMYNQLVSFGSYTVDEEGVIFTINDVALGMTCSTNVGMNMNSCIYTGDCTCCEKDD